MKTVPTPSHTQKPDDDIRAVMKRARENVGAALEARRPTREQLTSAFEDVALLALAIMMSKDKCAVFRAHPYFAKQGRWSDDLYLAAVKFSGNAVTTKDNTIASIQARVVEAFVMTLVNGNGVVDALSLRDKKPVK